MSEGEFDLIDRFFVPLTSGGPDPMALGDDVAVIADKNLIITKDVLIAGIHFHADDPMDLVARKALRVNISDIVAKGAKPVYYLLGCSWPTAISQQDIALFAKGLADDQRQFKCHLIGGDTTRHRLKSGPFTISITMLGDVPKDGPIRRNAAQAGDDVYVTGTIGDAGLGLMALSKKTPGKGFDDSDQAEFLKQRYWVPEPRIVFGSALTSFATAALDASDGVVADATHLAKQSKVGLNLNLDALPLSNACAHWLDAQGERSKALAKIASAGDDYEILFTAPKSLRRSVEVAAKASRTRVTRVGRAELNHPGEVRLSCGDCDDVQVSSSGFDHFR